MRRKFDILQMGGSDVVNAKGQWPAISVSLGFPGREQMLADIHERYLRDYELEWLAKRKSGNMQTASAGRVKPDHLGTNGTGSDNWQKLEDPSDGTHMRTPDNNSTVTKVSESVYRPLKRKFDTFANIDPLSASQISKELQRLRPYPTFAEFGNVDIQAISKSIQSNLPAEVANALDTLVIVAGDKRWGLPLSHCADLLETMVECLADNVARLPTVHDTEYRSYAQVVDHVRRSSSAWKNKLSNAPTQNAQIATRSAIQVIASVLNILRNLAFTEINQDTIAHCRNMAPILANAIQTFCGTKQGNNHLPLDLVLNFMKDTVTLLSQIGGNLIVDDPKIAVTLVKFLLTFTPTTPHKFELGSTSYDVLEHPYLAPAIDSYAKLVSRDTPNRQLFATILSPDTPLGRERLSSTMTLALAVLPDTSKGETARFFARRLPLLHHAFIIAETAANFSLQSESQAKVWLNDDGSLSYRLPNVLKTLTALSFEQGLEPDMDVIVQRILTILKLLSNRTRGSASTKAMTRAEKAILYFEAGIDI